MDDLQVPQTFLCSRELDRIFKPISGTAGAVEVSFSSCSILKEVRGNFVWQICSPTIQKMLMDVNEHWGSGNDDVM
jgi:hypothetical protein